MVSKRFGLSIAAAIAMLAAPATADVKAGVEAWAASRFGDAISAWRPLADRGDADAQFNMGQAYRLGRGVPADMGIARSWYQKAAQQGHAEAQANLGLILYQAGDRKAALPMIRKAAARGDERAQYVLGAMLYNGDLAARDWPRAYALMTLAAERGVANAQASLAEMDGAMPAADRERGKAMARQLGAELARAPVDRAAPSQRVPATRPQDTPAARSAAAVNQGAKMSPPVRRGISALVLPKPAPVAVKVAVPTAGGWRIQLGAFDNAAAARGHWSIMTKRIALLGGLQPSYEPAGRFTRLRTGPFASRSEADRACAAARAAGQACFPVRG